jgi:hypothetical protein
MGRSGLTVKQVRYQAANSLIIGHILLQIIIINAKIFSGDQPRQCSVKKQRFGD